MVIGTMLNLILQERANRKNTIELWQKIKTFEDPEWTRKYHDPDPRKNHSVEKLLLQ